MTKAIAFLMASLLTTGAAARADEACESIKLQQALALEPQIDCPRTSSSSTAAPVQRYPRDDGQWADHGQWVSAPRQCPDGTEPAGVIFRDPAHAIIACVNEDQVVTLFRVARDNNPSHPTPTTPSNTSKKLSTPPK